MTQHDSASAAQFGAAEKAVRRARQTVARAATAGDRRLHNRAWLEFAALVDDMADAAEEYRDDLDPDRGASGSDLPDRKYRAGHGPGTSVAPPRGGGRPRRKPRRAGRATRP